MDADTMLYSAQERLQILQWISKSEYGAHHLSFRKQRLDGTGEWLLAHPKFQDWQNSSESSILWLHGIRKHISPMEE